MTDENNKEREKRRKEGTRGERKGKRKEKGEKRERKEKNQPLLDLLTEYPSFNLSHSHILGNLKLVLRTLVAGFIGVVIFMYAGR